MPIDPIKIPQNVYIEDRIVGPLTLKQIIIVALGGGFSYVLWSTITKTIGSVNIVLTVLAWIPAVIAVIFAFVKINDLSMFRLCLLAVERFNKPSLRTWSPRRGISINVRTFSAQTQQDGHTQGNTKKDTRPLEAITDSLDSGMSPLEEELLLAPRLVPRSLGEEGSPEGVVGPVDKSKVSASPIVGGTPLDGIAPSIAAPAATAEPKAHSSIFRDLSPA